jgi:biopolymer transport protein ExbD
MTWKIRHEGSPRSIEGLSLPQVLEGLQDGLWEPTDEVMGPQEQQWVPIENHPQLADVAADLEPPLPRRHDDEARLDMNPLIDVCLVLLIFFILTTSYAALQKVLDMPGASRKGLQGPLRVTEKQVKEVTIKVEAVQENGKPVIRIEDTAVDPANLVAELGRWVSKSGKTELLLDARGVNWDTVVKIQDAAKGAKIDKIHFLLRPDEVR